MAFRPKLAGTRYKFKSCIEDMDIVMSQIVSIACDLVAATRDWFCMFHVLALKNTYITNKQMHVNKIISSYITCHQHVWVASATFIRLCYKNTNNIKRNALIVKLNPLNFTVNTKVVQI